MAINPLCPHCGNKGEEKSGFLIGSRVDPGHRPSHGETLNSAVYFICNECLQEFYLWSYVVDDPNSLKSNAVHDDGSPFLPDDGAGSIGGGPWFRPQIKKEEQADGQETSQD